MFCSSREAKSQGAVHHEPQLLKRQEPSREKSEVGVRVGAGVGMGGGGGGEWQLNPRRSLTGRSFVCSFVPL